MNREQVIPFERYWRARVNILRDNALRGMKELIGERESRMFVFDKKVSLEFKEIGVLSFDAPAIVVGPILGGFMLNVSDGSHQVGVKLKKDEPEVFGRSPDGSLEETIASLGGGLRGKLKRLQLANELIGFVARQLRASPSNDTSSIQH